MESCPIPAADRLFSVDRNTGVVTVSDATGALGDVVLPYRERQRLDPKTYASNDVNPITRYGLEWVIDFKRIRPINTTIRLDGSFYGYYSMDQNLVAECPHTVTGADREYYKYIGFYFGGDNLANGRESRRLTTNLTITTHIPKVRMILSLRTEMTLLRYSRSLSENPDGSPRARILMNRDDVLSIADGSIYEGENYYVLYPAYYTTYDDPDTHRNYYEDLLWAKENDSNLYSDLQRLAVTTNYNYFFKKDNYTPYFSMNFSITKEIGDIASISFYANNFFNNMGQIYSTRSGNWVSLDSATFLPNFYYGLTLRLKF